MWIQPPANDQKLLERAGTSPLPGSLVWPIEQVCSKIRVTATQCAYSIDGLSSSVHAWSSQARNTSQMARIGASTILSVGSGIFSPRVRNTRILREQLLESQEYCLFARVVPCHRTKGFITPYRTIGLLCQRIQESTRVGPSPQFLIRLSADRIIRSTSEIYLQQIPIRVQKWWWTCTSLGWQNRIMDTTFSNKAIAGNLW